MPQNPDIVISIGLFAIFFIVLFGPFLVKKIEHNLEVFLCIMGVLAITLDHFRLKVSTTAIDELLPSWNFPLIKKALEDPIEITLAVFVVGFLFHYGRNKIKSLITFLLKKISPALLVCLMIIALGLLSSVITAIIASLVLVEFINTLSLNRKTKVAIVVVACFAIGLGAALTPVGEPLSTIVIRTKLQENFWYLLYQIGKYIIPGVVAMGVLSMFFLSRKEGGEPSLGAAEEKESFWTILIRAFKVYVFVMALVFLGIGFMPITEWYIKPLRPETLYWANTVSAILDNATLASAEITKTMDILQLHSALMALLIAGGMLIPGNIPNIIAANKLGITSREWARIGVPLGALVMVVYFAILFAPGWTNR